MKEPSIKRTLTRNKCLSLIEELEKDRDVTGTTFYLETGLPASEIYGYLDTLDMENDMRETTATLVERSGTGAVVLNTKPFRILLPAFPIQTTVLHPSLELQPLKAQLQKDYVIGVVLVRLGAYAVGVADGEKLITSKTGTGLVHGRHRQGGSSAHRFERHRDKQIEYFFTRLCGHAREHLEPYLKDMDFMVYGGARTTIELLKKQCEFLSRINIPELPPLLDIPDPRQKVLEAGVTGIWSSILYEWGED